MGTSIGDKLPKSGPEVARCGSEMGAPSSAFGSVPGQTLSATKNPSVPPASSHPRGFTEREEASTVRVRVKT